jgi:hypothetical protein
MASLRLLQRERPRSAEPEADALAIVMRVFGADAAIIAEKPVPERPALVSLDTLDRAVATHPSSGRWIA